MPVNPLSKDVQKYLKADPDRVKKIAREFLTPGEFEVFEKVYFTEGSLKEKAAELGFTFNYLQTRISRIRQILLPRLRK